MEISNTIIQNVITSLSSTTTNAEIATLLNVTRSKVGANYSALKIKGTKLDELNQLTTKIYNEYFKKAMENATNSFSNVDGEYKNIARLKSALSMINSGVDGTILSLPYADCKFEKIVLSSTNNDFIGVERDKQTYDVMKKTIQHHGLNIKPHFGNISDCIYGAEENTYAHLNLDYCGVLSTFKKEIEYVRFNNVVKVGGFINITFAKRGLGEDKKLKSLMNVKTNAPKDDRCEADKAIQTYFSALVGLRGDYELVEIYNYQDKKENGQNKCPMVMVQIKRIK